MIFSKSCTIGIFALLSFASAAFADQRDAVKELVNRIHEVASAKTYTELSEQEKTLIKEIVPFGPDALPRLAELLLHDRREVTVVAAEAIEEIARNIESIDEKFLPAILHGLDNGHSGLPNALARVKTAEARAEYLSRYLKDSSSPHNQYQNGFRWHSADFLPHIIKAIRSENGTSDQNVYLLGTALESFSAENRKAAALELLKVFVDDGTASEAKPAILAMISRLGPPALAVEDQLIKIWENQPGLKEEAARALVGMRSKKAGIILAEEIKRRPDYLLLRDIAEVGFAAEDAGAEVAKLLDHSDWKIRLGAARTIGFIGFHGADTRLMELLSEPSDVRLNYVAAEALGRLKSKVALQVLNTAAKNHWHSAVREAARTAVGKIESDSDYEVNDHVDSFPEEYFAFQYMGVESPEDYRIPAVVEPSSLSAHAETDPELIRKLSYPSEIVSYGASDEEEQKAEKGEDAVIVVNENNVLEHRRKISQTPEVGIRVTNGWLLGADRGEWGGELVFTGDHEEHYCVLRDNIHELFKLGERVIAVTGLAHLSLNNGLIYELKLVGGTWRAVPWRALPGAPVDSGKLKSGEIMVATNGGGILILSENGDFRMADTSSRSDSSERTEE